MKTLTCGPDLVSFLMTGSSVVVTVWKILSILYRVFSFLMLTRSQILSEYSRAPHCIKSGSWMLGRESLPSRGKAFSYTTVQVFFTMTLASLLLMGAAPTFFS